MGIEQTIGRPLTPGEVELARSIFGEEIDYRKVRVYNKSYLPFNMQKDNYAMSPNGNMYYLGLYQTDFSKTDISDAHLFIHEMTHVWQSQKGMNVRLRGSMSWAADYEYSFKGKNTKLSSYSMEQQASIVADYYLLRTAGLNRWRVDPNGYKSNNVIYRPTPDSDDLFESIRKYGGDVQQTLLDKYKSILTEFPASL